MMTLVVHYNVCETLHNAVGWLPTMKSRLNTVTSAKVQCVDELPDVGSRFRENQFHRIPFAMSLTFGPVHQLGEGNVRVLPFAAVDIHQPIKHLCEQAAVPHGALGQCVHLADLRVPSAMGCCSCTSERSVTAASSPAKTFVVAETHRPRP